MKKRVLCYGDSNTWGYNGLTRARFDDGIRWTNRLQTKLGDSYVIIEEGLNGRTSVWYDPVENIMSGLDYLWPCMKSHNPLDLVVINLGVNDCKPLFAANPWSIATGVQRLVDMAMQSPFGRDGSAPEVLLIAPFPIGNELLACERMLNIYGAEGLNKSRALAPFYAAAARESGCRFADAADWAFTGPDGIHMAEECLDGFADRMLLEIKKILG